MSMRDNNDIAAKIVYEAMRWAVANQQGLRDGKTPSWVDHGNGFAQEEARSAADAIIAALPDMIKPLVWDDYPMGSSCKIDNDDYSINYWEHEGVFVDAYTTMHRQPTLELAKAAANAHHRAAIMAAFNLT
jgi:hypothetical protein